MSNNNIKKLKAFVVVAVSGSVTVASSRLALTQSGVSRQIMAMEEDVGFALFNQVRGRLYVSQKGAAFLRHVWRTLDALKNLPRAELVIASGAEDRTVIAGTSTMVHLCRLLSPTILPNAREHLLVLLCSANRHLWTSVSMVTLI